MPLCLLLTESACVPAVSARCMTNDTRLVSCQVLAAGTANRYISKLSEASASKGYLAQLRPPSQAMWKADDELLRVDLRH